MLVLLLITMLSDGHQIMQFMRSLRDESAGMQRLDLIMENEKIRQKLPSGRTPHEDFLIIRSTFILSLFFQVWLVMVLFDKYY